MKLFNQVDNLSLEKWVKSSKTIKYSKTMEMSNGKNDFYTIFFNRRFDKIESQIIKKL